VARRTPPPDLQLAALRPRPRQRRRWGGATAGRLALLGLAALLSGLPLAAPSLAASEPVAGAAAATAGVPARQPGPAANALDDPTLLRLEFAARAHPMHTASELGSYARSLPDSDVRRWFALGLQANLLASHNELDEATRCLHLLQQHEAGHPLAAATAQWARAAMAERQGTQHRPARLLTEALAGLPADAPALLRYHLLAKAAAVQLQIGQLDEAVRLRQQGILLADQMGPDWRRADARHGLTYALIKAEQFDRAAEQHAENLALAQRAGDDVALSRALNNESFLRSQANDRNGERAALENSIAAARRAGARELEVRGIANLSDHYLLGADYITALALAQQALPLAQDLADLTAESVALYNIGLALVSMHQREAGLASLKKAMALDERMNALPDLAGMLDEQGGYLERAGYAADAYAAFRRYRKLSDEVLRQDQQQAVIELQEGFDNQRRQRELDLLQRQNRLQQTELDNHALQQRVWATAVVAGVLLLGVAALLLRRLRHHSAALAEGNARLRTQSEIDPLTGLANRHHLLRRMQPEGVPAAPFTGALLLVDLDHFKRVNDQHGHAVGDEVLVEASRRLQAALREDDLVVRWGGEEFLVVSPAAEPGVLQLLAERLLVALAGMPVTTANGPLAISASIGFAGFPLAPSGVELDWERAVDLVDTALYLAKAHGRNRAYGVRAVQTDSAPALRELSRRLEAAWREGEVTLTALTGPALPAPHHNADGVTA